MIVAPSQTEITPLQRVISYRPLFHLGLVAGIVWFIVHVVLGV